MSARRVTLTLSVAEAQALAALADAWDVAPGDMATVLAQPASRAAARRAMTQLRTALYS